MKRLKNNTVWLFIRKETSCRPVGIGMMWAGLVIYEIDWFSQKVSLTRTNDI